MTKDFEWKMAKWVKHHPNTRVCDLPAWFDLSTQSSFFCRDYKRNPAGYPDLSPDDRLIMLDRHKEAFKAEQTRRLHAFRDWIEPVVLVLSFIMSLVALIRTF